MEGVTTFKRLQMVKTRGNNFYAAVDTNGYLTVLTRNLRFKTRVYTKGYDVKNIAMLKDTLAVVHPTDVAFIRLTDGKMNQWFCEGSNTGEYELTSIIQPETYRTQQHFLYIFNTLGELVIFEVGLPKGGDRNG